VYVADSLMFKGFVMRIHENGTLIWIDTLGKNGDCVINDLVVDNNDEIAMVGKVIYPTGEISIFEGKGTSNGTFFIENQAILSGSIYYTGITTFGNSDRYLTVQSFDNEFSYGGYDLAISQNSPWLGWEMNIGQVNYIHDEEMGELIHTSDDGAVVVGSILDSWMGGGNVFIFKFYYGQSFANSNNDFTTSPIVSVNTIYFDDDKLKIYPNPFSEKFEIEGIDSTIEYIEIISISGKTINKFPVTMLEFTDLSELSVGTYFIRLIKKDNICASQTLIQKI
jgi:hypothetical protein